MLPSFLACVSILAGVIFNFMDLKLITIGVLSAFLLLPLQNAHAQETVTLSVSPPVFELSANPGDKLENVIRVSNPHEDPLRVSVDTRNFVAVGEGGSVGLTEEETSYSLASWISVSPTESEIPAKSSRYFNVQTKVPLNAEPGGHFGSVVFKTGGGTVQQTGAAVTQELGALFLLRVSGKVTEEGRIESFSPVKNFWEYGPVYFDLRVGNKGNVHIKPQGKITITNLLGKKAAEVEVAPQNVLPSAVRKFSPVWEKELLFGKYIATASLVYGSDSEVLNATTTFYAFPYRVGGAALVGLVALGYLLYRGRKRIALALRILFGKKDQS